MSGVVSNEQCVFFFKFFMGSKSAYIAFPLSKEGFSSKLGKLSPTLLERTTTSENLHCIVIIFFIEEIGQNWNCKLFSIIRLNQSKNREKFFKKTESCSFVVKDIFLHVTPSIFPQSDQSQLKYTFTFFYTINWTYWNWTPSSIIILSHSFISMIASLSPLANPSPLNGLVTFCFGIYFHIYFALEVALN